MRDVEVIVFHAWNESRLLISELDLEERTVKFLDPKAKHPIGWAGLNRYYAEVVINIYNIKGELVRTLSIGHKPAGCYLSKEKAVFWNGKNQSGEAVANGLYFYTLKAGEFQAVRKMILVK